MSRWDYFSGGSARWRHDAKIRARQVLGEQPDDPVHYALKRIGRSRLGSFERRRWRYIRKLLLKHVRDEQARVQRPRLR